jgi:hypothetical protein
LKLTVYLDLGGYLIISGGLVRWKNKEKEWDELQAMAGALCYKLITVDGNTVLFFIVECAWNCFPS